MVKIAERVQKHRREFAQSGLACSNMGADTRPKASAAECRRQSRLLRKIRMKLRRCSADDIADARLDSVKRGDLVSIALQGAYGKPRPAVVVQADLFVEHPS